MKKYFYYLLTVLCLSVAFVSCSSDDDDSPEVKHLQVTYTAPTYKTFNTPSVEFFTGVDDAYGCLVVGEKLRNVFYNAHLDGEISRDESYAMASMLDYLYEHSQVAETKYQTRGLMITVGSIVFVSGVGLISTFNSCSKKIAENNIQKLDLALKERGCGLESFNSKAISERRKYYNLIKQHDPDLVAKYEKEVNPSNAFWSDVVERKADNATNRINDILFDERLGNNSLLWTDAYAKSNVITYNNMCKVTHDMADTGKDVIATPATTIISAIGAGMNVVKTITQMGEVKKKPDAKNQGKLFVDIAQNALDILHLGKEIGFEWTDFGDYNTLFDFTINKNAEMMAEYYENVSKASAAPEKKFTGTAMVAETDKAYYVSNNGKISIPAGETVTISRANEDGTMDVVTTTVEKDTDLDELLAPKEEETIVTDGGFAKIACSGEWHVTAIMSGDMNEIDEEYEIVYMKFNTDGSIRVTTYDVYDKTETYMTWYWEDLGGGKLKITIVDEDGHKYSVEAKYSLSGSVLTITYTSGPVKGDYMRLNKM